MCRYCRMLAVFEKWGGVVSSDSTVMRPAPRSHADIHQTQHFFKTLTPKDHYRGRTAPLTSKRCILYIYSTNIGTEYFKHGIYSPFFFPFKMQFVS